MIRKATMNDVPRILELVNGYARNGLMLMKTPYQIYRNIQSFYVCEVAGEVVGCCRLNIIWKNLAEVASLAVAETHKRQGIGKQLVQKVIDEGVSLGICEFFTLTYQDAFFQGCGFYFVERESLPHKVFGDCLMCPKIECCDEHAYMYRVAD